MDAVLTRLSVSNSLSGRPGSWTKARQWETQRTLFSSARATHVAAGEGQQRVVLQRRVAAYLVVGGQTPGATQRCLNPGFSERIGNSRRTPSAGGTWRPHAPESTWFWGISRTPLPACARSSRALRRDARCTSARRHGQRPDPLQHRPEQGRCCMKPLAGEVVWPALLLTLCSQWLQPPDGAR